MSFAYFPFYTGDYYRDTRHLSMLQHGAYRQLLDHCWDQKGPLPLDLEKCYRICGAVSKEEQECVRGVIGEFFIRMEDGHYQKRVMEEIAKAEQWSQKSRIGGLKSAVARRSKVRQAVVAKRLQPPFNHPSTTVQPPSVSPSPSPSPSLFQTPIPPPPDQQRTVVGRAAPSATAQPAPPDFDGDNLDKIPPRAVVTIASTWGPPLQWGKDAEALGWKPAAIIKEGEKFRQYWTAGRGAGTRRTIKGWRQAWSNWLAKAERMSA